jgi:predicted transcriptional regulator of viral defense system
MKSRWATFKDFIRSKEVGYIFTRKELHRVLYDEQEAKEKWSGVPKSTIYICVGNMFKAGCLKWVSRGKYQLIGHPSEEMTIGDCALIAKGDNLSYIEKLHKRRERIKSKGDSK